MAHCEPGAHLNTGNARDVMAALGDLDMKLGKERGERSAAMAERELGLQVNFSHGAVTLWEIKQRIVAEAAGAARRVEDHTFDGAIGHVCKLTVARGNEHAMIAGGALGRRNSVETLEKDDVIPDIGVVVGIGRIDQAGVSGEARGADAGSAGEGIDFEAGVVGEDESAGCELGVVDGFECCVFGEGFAVFFRRLDVGELRQRIDGDGVRLGGGTEVAQLSFAGSGDVQAKGHQSEFKVRRRLE
jgi:hypothetical protein